MDWVAAAVAPPSRTITSWSTTSKYSSNLHLSWFPSASPMFPNNCPSLHNYCLQLHLWTHSITASKCISKFIPSWPPSVYPNSLNDGLHVGMIMVSKCISRLARSRHRSTYFMSDSGCTEIQGWCRWTERRGVYSQETHGLIDIISFSSLLIIRRKYTHYLSQLFVSLAPSEISWILTAT